MPKNAKSDEKSRRLRERIGLKIPVRVHGRDSIDAEWKELSRLVDVTPLGARLRLKRPTEPGRLLHLIMAMPRQLRAFDHAEDQYRVWSLVRNLKLLSPDDDALMEIGVAFVGKRPPKSFESDPARRYEIVTAGKETEAALWSVQEESGEVLSEAFVDDKRKETRHTIPIDVLIELFDAEGKLSQRERTVTENISCQGASVFTTLDVSPGRFVKLSSEQYRTSALAAVRNRRTGPDGVPRLHLQFVGSEWPL